MARETYDELVKLANRCCGGNENQPQDFGVLRDTIRKFVGEESYQTKIEFLGLDD